MTMSVFPSLPVHILTSGSFYGQQITPDPTTPKGYAIRSALLAITDIFEVNRKECARLLLEYPKWSLPGMFKPKPGAPPPPDGENGTENEGKEWQLESTILEVCLPFCLSTLFLTLYPTKSDDPQRPPCPACFISKINLLHLPHYRTLQALTPNRRPRRREEYTTAVRAAE